MLHDFLVTHKSELIRLCKVKSDLRTAPDKRDLNMDYGIPLFIDQLIETLRSERESLDANNKKKYLSLRDEHASESALIAAATQHGREMSKYEMTVEHLVHEYGDLCQEMTKLAIELDAPIDVSEFRIFNRCLDDAIANAFTEYSYQKDALAASRGSHVVDERLRVLANEQRHHLRTAQLAMKAIRAGNVGLNGATGAILELSLASLQKLQDRFLNGWGWSTEVPSRINAINVADFIAEVKETPLQRLQGTKYKFTVRDIDKELTILADSDLLFVAVGTLLEKSFRSVLKSSEIILSARAAGERVLIEITTVDDESFVVKQESIMPLNGADKSLENRDEIDLSMCRRSIEASKGFLRFRDVAGANRVFTVDLPRNVHADTQ